MLSWRRLVLVELPPVRGGVACAVAAGCPGSPGGGAGPDSSPLEKVYVVLSGSLTVRTSDQDVTLGPLDSCCIPGGETREVKNLTNEVVTMLVVMPYPQVK